ERGAVLIAVGGDLSGERSPLRLSVTDASWSGLDRGAGHLRCRTVTVEATGRGDAARPRHARLWLPGPDGEVSTWTPDPVVELPTARRAGAGAAGTGAVGRSAAGPGGAEPPTRQRAPAP